MGHGDGNEFDQYKQQVKNSIRKLVEEQQYNEAIQLISEYEDIVGCNDIEILSIQANIAFFRGEIDKAESLCKEILYESPDHVDSLYNLAYIFQNKGYWEGALYFYKRALQEYKKAQGREELERQIVAVTLELDLLNQKRSAKQDNVSVSVAVLAYNQLEYTKLCVDSFYKYTSHFSFELITVDNGSSDETANYFTWLPNQKKVHFKENQGGIKAIDKAFRCAQGKYVVFLSNDLVLTENWLDNLITCIESDEKIGLVVPACSFSSAYQQVNLNYNSLAEMQRMAKQYNKSNTNKWEERIRLITYMFLMRTEQYLQHGWEKPIYLQGGFDDDDLSFSVRRAGYKLIFARDTFIHHFGSKTITNDYQKYNLLERNRKVFFNKFGVDAWDDTEYIQEIFSVLSYPKTESNVSILEIGNSCGATALQFKNVLRAKGFFSVRVSYFTEMVQFLQDLKSVGDTVYYNKFSKIDESICEEKFDYVLINGVIDEMVNGELEFDDFFFRISRLVHENSQVVFFISNPGFYKKVISCGISEFINQSIDESLILTKMRQLGYTEARVYNLNATVSDENKEIVDSLEAIGKVKGEYFNREKLTCWKFMYIMTKIVPQKIVAMYPGYDSGLKNAFLYDRTTCHLGIDVGKLPIEILADTLTNHGCVLNSIDMVNLRKVDYAIYYDVPKSHENPIFSSIYQHIYKGEYYFNQLVRTNKMAVKILVLYESPFIMPENYDKKWHGKFDYIFTWNDDLIDNIKYFKFNYCQPSKVENPFAKSFQEKKLCTLVAGNKSCAIPGELYSERLRTIQYFERKHNGKFEFYGTGWETGKYKNYKGVIPGKLEVMSNYRFAICYENGIMNGYITEKIFDCFFAQCVPVYWGAPNITTFIPANTFIDRRAFRTHDELYQFLNSMTEDIYERYIFNIQRFLNSQEYQAFTYETYVNNIMKFINKD